jgi:Holliday junction resolvase
VELTSPQKRKGSAAELAVAKWLRKLGWIHAERSRSGWQDDRGDIDGMPGVCIEVKAEKKIDIPGYLRELEVEIENAKAWTGTVIIKRRGSTNVDDWYAVMPAKIWGELMLMLDQPNQNSVTPTP